MSVFSCFVISAVVGVAVYSVGFQVSWDLFVFCLSALLLAIRNVKFYSTTSLAPPPPKPWYEEILRQDRGFNPAGVILSWLLDMDCVTAANIVLSILVLLCTWKLAPALIESFRRIRNKRKNRLVFETESVRPSSPLAKVVSLAPSQVLLYNISPLEDVEYLGSAVRVGTELYACPEHVVRGIDSKVGLSKMLNAPIHVVDKPLIVPSRVHCDLVYFKIASSVSSKVGVSVAKLQDPALPAQMVNLIGFDGKKVEASMGSLRLSSFLQHMVEYDGSSKRGYSGAPYHVGSVVFGIHTGSTEPANVGIPSVVLRTEIAHLIKNESSEDFDQKVLVEKRLQYTDIEADINAAYDVRAFQAKVDKKFKEEEEFIKNSGSKPWFEYESLRSEVKTLKTCVEALSAQLGARPSATYGGQSPVGSEVTVPTKPSVENRLAMLELDVTTLKAEIANIVEKLAKQPATVAVSEAATQVEEEKVPPPVVTEKDVSLPEEVILHKKCRYCSKLVLIKESGMWKGHGPRQCATIRLESAYPSDHQTGVATSSRSDFLGKRRVMPLQKKKGQNSNEVSSSLAGIARSLDLLLESQKRMFESLQNFGKN